MAWHNKTKKISWLKPEEIHSINLPKKDNNLSAYNNNNKIIKKNPEINKIAQNYPTTSETNDLKH